MAINLFGREAVWSARGDEHRRGRRAARHPDPRLRRRSSPTSATAATPRRSCRVWRNTLDHFDAIKIGLTATPAAHTTAYFNDVVYRYEYARAVREGYLVDYDVVDDQVRRPHERRLSQGGRAGRHGRPRDRRSSSSTSWRTSGSSTPPRSSRRSPRPTRTGRSSRRSRSTPPSTSSSYGRFPKTLIFAANDLPHTSHADQLVDTGRDVFGRGRLLRPEDHRPRRPAAPAHPRVPQPPEPGHRRHGGPAVHRRRHPRPGVHRLPAPGEVAHPLRADARPRHAQGREVPRQVALHRLRLLRRHAARVLPQGHRHHGRAAGAADAGRSREIIEDIWDNRDRDYNIRCLVKRLQRIDKEMSGEARELFAAYDPGRRPRPLRRASCPRRSRRTSPATMKLLRDPDFQDLLVELPAAAAHASSWPTRTRTPSRPTWLIRDGAGSEYKPEDYLDGLRPVRARERRRRSRPSGSCSTGRRTGAPTALDGAARRSSPPRPQRFTDRATSRRRTSCATTRLWSTSSPWSSTRPTRRNRC